MISPTEYCQGWRQIRVFIKDFRIEAFAEFADGPLTTAVKAGFECPFFISVYACDDGDSNDTTIANLPNNYRRPRDNNHHSIRIRFKETGGMEELLTKHLPKKPDDCWYSEFLDYTIMYELSGTRFSDYSMADSEADKFNHCRRAYYLGEILHHSTRFTIRHDATGKAIFETSNSGYNIFLKSPVQSVLHMIMNPYERSRDPANPKFLGDDVKGIELNGQSVKLHKL